MRKRKAVDQGSHKGAKKGMTLCVLTDADVDQSRITMEMAEAVEPMDPTKVVETAFLEECQAHYTCQEKSSCSRYKPSKGKVRPDIEEGSVMNDFINTPHGVKCYQVMPQLFFQND